MKSRIWFTVLLALANPISASAFTVVDDFDVAPYYVVVEEPLDVHVPVGTVGVGHVISPTRHFALTPSAIHGGLLRVGIGSDEIQRMQLWSETGYGEIEIEWDWGFPGDLTEGGAVDEIGFDFTIAPQEGMNVVITFQDVNGLHGIGRIISSDTLYTFPLSDWTTIDMTQVTGLSLKFQFSGQDSPAIIELNDVRTIGERTVTPDFLGVWTLVETDPLPSAPCIFRTLDEIGNPVYQTEIGWQDIQVVGPIPALHGVWSDRPLGNGEACGITMTTDPQGGYIYDWYGTYELFVNIVDVPGVDAAIAFPPDPIEPQDGMMSLALPFQVATNDGGGELTGESNVLLTITLSENQPAEFMNPVVVPVFSRGLSVAGFHLYFDLVLHENILDSEPIFEFGWSSDWQRGLPAGVDGEALRITKAGLSARPSVTPGATELRAERPFAQNEVVQLFDVGGRLVRELHASPGTESVIWDGREASGSRPAPGVYFARRSADPAGRPARIVTVR
jgi:hypothetical protein